MAFNYSAVLVIPVFKQNFLDIFPVTVKMLGFAHYITEVKSHGRNE